MATQYWVETNAVPQSGGDRHAILGAALQRCLGSIALHLEHGVAVEDDTGWHGRSTIAGWRELGLDVTTPGKPMEVTIRLLIGPAWDRDIEDSVLRVEAAVDQPVIVDRRAV